MVLRYLIDSRKEIKVQEPDKNKIKVDTEHTALDETSRIVWLKIEQGHGMCREGKLVEAIELYTEVVNEEDIKPIYKLLAYLSRGTVLGHLKKLEDAYNDFSKVLKVQSIYQLLIGHISENIHSYKQSTPVTSFFPNNIFVLHFFYAKILVLTVYGQAMATSRMAPSHFL